VTQTATSPQRKPLLDEASFQQLLSAAYVLQEHNDRLRAKEFQAGFAENLSAIVETQKLIQTLQLDLAAAAELVAERVQKITHASGAAIGIIEKGQLFYRAVTGSATIDAGTRLAPDSALSADCLSKGSALNYPDVSTAVHGRDEIFRARDVKAFIAVPVYHAGQVAGVLELRFARAHAFREADLRAAELMAGLLSEAMVTAARMKWKEALASERQSMLEALERIKPQLERLGSDSIGLEEVATANPVSPADPGTKNREPLAPRVASSCSACGSDFFDDSESFCGICGTARTMASAKLDGGTGPVPNRIDPPWLTPYAQETPSNGNSVGNVLRVESTAAKQTLPAQPVTSGSKATESRSAALREIDSMPAMETASATSVAPSDPFQVPAVGSTDALRIVPAEMVPGHVIPADTVSANMAVFELLPEYTLPAALVPTDPTRPDGRIQPYPWGSARKAQQWLETVKGHRAQWLAEQWQRRRANIYVVLAAVILLLVISGWGIRPAGTTAAGNAAPAAAGQHQAPPTPQLTLFEKLLVNLGLAEPPPAPVYMGNPETQVWVDVHTALYYCPGSDLYGKTADGKFTSQKDAQQDQFEPANRKACP
jgi:hypothetical protein